MRFNSGDQVGPYTIEAKVGQGGMATVYRAYQPALDRYVAIKVMHDMFAGDDAISRRFRREARAVARLEHAHIIPIYDYAEHQGHPYIVMRFVEGETLKVRLSRGRADDAELMDIMSKVAAGLDYAHSQHILHRDIKPSNIILTDSGGVYITDFGLARVAQAGESTISQGMMIGTPQYISPEQARGDEQIDHRADLYSFGIILYEMITGRVPFNADSTFSIIHDQIFTPPPSPLEFVPALPPGVADVVLQALAKDPAQRFASAETLLSSLRRALTGRPAPPRPVADADPPGATQLASIPAAAVPASASGPAPGAAAGARASGAAATRQPARRRTRRWWWIGLGLFGCIGCLFTLAVINGLQNQPAGAGNPASTPFAPAPTALPASDVPAESPVGDGPGNTPDADGPADQAPTSEAPPAGDAGPDDAGATDFPDLAALLEEARPVDVVEAELRLRPRDRRLRSELAMALIKEGRGEEAFRLLQELYSGVRVPWPFLSGSNQLLEAGQLKAATLLLRVGYEKFPQEPTLQQNLLLASMLESVEPRLIQTLVDDLQGRETDPVNVLLGTAYLTFRAGDASAAVAALEEAVTAGEEADEGELYLLLGQLYIETGAPERAVTVLRTGLDQAYPGWLRPHFQAALRRAGAAP